MIRYSSQSQLNDGVPQKWMFIPVNMAYRLGVERNRGAYYRGTGSTCLCSAEAVWPVEPQKDILKHRSALEVAARVSDGPEDFLKRLKRL